MIRVIKPDGFGNIQLQDVPIPTINSRQVLVRTGATLISRGSELFARYIKEEAVSPSIMGYSLTGTVEKIGSDVTEYQTNLVTFRGHRSTCGTVDRRKRTAQVV